MVCVFLGMVAVGCDLGQTVTAGAVGTGNAGRVQGRLVGSKDNSTLDRYSVRLLQIDSGMTSIRSVVECDSQGTFSFPLQPAGSYAIEAWSGGVLRGRSARFEVNGDATGIVVVLLDMARQVDLDLTQIGDVDSLYVDYPENPGVRIDGRWLAQSYRDTGFVLYTHLAGPSHRWEGWIYLVRDGKVVLVNQEDQRSVTVVRKVDTSSFSRTPQTVALWSFDTLLGGRVEDRSGHGNDLLMPAGVELVGAPFGKAWSIHGNQRAKTAGDSVPPALRWSTTGELTCELRLRLDSLPLEGMFLLGGAGFSLHVAPDGKLAIAGQWIVNDSTKGWFAITSESGALPIGRWFNLAVSIDQQRVQTYAWIDERPVPLYFRDSWASDAKFLENFSAPFSVGGIGLNRISSYFVLDEVRISDILVFGRGYEIKPDWESNLDFSQGLEMQHLVRTKDSGVVDEPGDTAWVGLEPAGIGVGELAMRFRVPPSVRGRTIVSAFLYLWDNADTPDREVRFDLHPLRSPWGLVGARPAWTDSHWRVDPATVDPLYRSVALILGTQGGLVFDVTTLVQRWVDDSASNQGVLVRAHDEMGEIGRSLVASDEYGAEFRPRINIKYR